MMVRFNRLTSWHSWDLLTISEIPESPPPDTSPTTSDCQVRSAPASATRRCGFNPRDGYNRIHIHFSVSLFFGFQIISVDQKKVSPFSKFPGKRIDTRTYHWMGWKLFDSFLPIFPMMPLLQTQLLLPSEGDPESV